MMFSFLEIPISQPSKYTVINGELFLQPSKYTVINGELFLNTMISSETMLFLRSRFYSRRLEIESGRPKSPFPLCVIDISESVVESVISDGFFNIAPYSCNGLCYSYRDGDDGLVWNARSGERVKKVGFSNYVPPANYWYDNLLAKLCFAGLGFDSMSGDYKVIEFMEGFPPYSIGGAISVVLYSFKSESWKRLIWDDGNSKKMPNEVDGGVVYKDGVLHWMRGGSIYAFNFATECFSSCTSRPERFGVQLVDFRGDLGVVSFNNETNSYELWRVQKDGWVKQFSFSVDLDTNDEYHAWKRMRNGNMLFEFLAPMGFSNELLFLRTPTGCIFLYDSISKQVSKSPFPDAWQTLKWWSSMLNLNSSETILFLKIRFEIHGPKSSPPPPPPPNVMDISESVISDGFVNFVGYSCNGLCYSCRDGGDGLVWNPTTGERVTEVAFSAPDPVRGERVTKLALSAPDHVRVMSNSIEYKFHRRLIMFAGLGFDSVSSDYKVIAFVVNEFDIHFTGRGKCRYDCLSNEESPCSRGESETMSVMLYSLSSNSWKPLNGHCPCIPCESNGGVVYKDGILHWMRGGFIYAFNFATECFSKCDCPLRNFNELLVDFRGDLGVFSFNEEASCYELWVVGRKFGWVKQFTFTVDLPDDYEYEISLCKELLAGLKEPSCDFFYFPIGFFNGLMFLKSTSHQIIFYDSVSNKVIKSPVPNEWETLKWWSLYGTNRSSSPPPPPPPVINVCRQRNMSDTVYKCAQFSQKAS